MAANAPTAKLSSVEMDTGALPDGADVEADMMGASASCFNGLIVNKVVVLEVKTLPKASGVAEKMHLPSESPRSRSAHGTFATKVRYIACIQQGKQSHRSTAQAFS